MRGKTAEDLNLLELLDPVAEAAGYAIVRLRLMGGEHARRLQIMAERPSDGDMNVEDCARLSRAISEVMDAADPIAGEYTLEVSSPDEARPALRCVRGRMSAGLLPWVKQARAWGELPSPHPPTSCGGEEGRRLSRKRADKIVGGRYITPNIVR